MFKKGVKLYSIITGNCPKCHEESMYTNRNPYQLSAAFSMYETCSCCGTKYKIEPSFFYGSMYVSYAVSIAFAVGAFILSHFIFHAEINTIFLSIMGTLIVFMPVILRLSRNIWINLFIDYDAASVNLNPKKND